MLTFDRLKLVADLNSIVLTDEQPFEKTLKDDVLMSMKFYRKSPNLMIKIDYTKKEVVIEFSGKILGDRYPELISINNIGQCFRNIEKLGVCKFDMDLIMKAEVVSCDVTKDIPCGDIHKIQTYIKSHISNYNKYLCRALKNGNLILEKNVTTKKMKKRMTVYDKGKEMNLADNLNFVQENALQGVFDGKCRFEVNLNSKEQIRQALGIGSNSLKDVLSSTENPIADFLEESVTQKTEDSQCSDWKSYQRLLVLQDCDFDLEKVEAKIRSLYKRGTKISEVLKPYRETFNQLEGKTPNDFDKVLEMLR